MKVALYHEINLSAKESVLKNGIKRGVKGEKTDAEKKKVDVFLDTHLPDDMQKTGASRQKAVYAYLEHRGSIIDIKDGQAVPIGRFQERSRQLLLKITADSDDCYVSDLDLYDTLTRALELDEQTSTREHLAESYWRRLTPLNEFEIGEITRPEVLIFRDIPPGDIEVVRPG